MSEYSRPDAGLNSDPFEMVSALVIGVRSVNEPIVAESFDEIPIDVGLDGVILLGFDW